MKTSSITFYFLGLLASLAIRAQDKNAININYPLFEEITIEDDDGLHSWSDIEQLYQSDDGALWIQINEGIFRYNGHSAINVTRHLSTNDVRLDDQPTTRFLLDDEKNLWLGRRKGLFKINLETNKIQEIYLDQPANPQNWRNYVLELEMFNDTIFVGSANGLYLIDKKSGKKLKSYLTDGKDVKHRESSKAVQSIFPNIEKGAIWAALMDGFYRIDRNKDTIERHLVTEIWPDTLAHNFSNGYLADKKLYLSSYGLGMVAFDLNNKRFNRHPTSVEQADDYTYNIIRTVIKISDSTLLINATKRGNAVFNMNTNTYQWLPTPDIFKEGVFLYLDKSGFVWGGKRGRLFRTEKPVILTNGKNKVIFDVSAVYANGRLLTRPSIDGYLPIELRENENNIKLDFSITEPHLHKDLHYEYQLNQEAWRPIKDKNQLELFGLQSSGNTIRLRAKDKAENVLASTKIFLDLVVPFYKTPLFLVSLGLLAILLTYFLVNYFNQKEVSKKLQELDTVKSNFFANISHELRTPLTLIKGPLEEQLESPGLTVVEKQNLSIAKNNTERLETLVNQLLDLSKLESGFYKLNATKGNLSNFLKAVSESFSYQAKEKNQLLDIDITFGGSNFFYDKDVLQKVVTNLLGNALKYSPEKAKIKLQAKVENPRLHLTVQNTGVSLHNEELSQLFNRFHRGNENEPGTGIGLALTKELVELHKGTIKAESQSDSITFLVELPIVEEAFETSEKSVTVKNQSSIETPTPPIIPSKEIVSAESKIDSELPILLMG